MRNILSLRASVSKEAALEQLEPSGLRRFLGSPLRRLASVYVPYRLYKVMIDSRMQQQKSMFAVDVVKGNLDIFGFDSIPETVELEAKNLIAARLSLEQSANIIREHVRRMVFKQGFCQIRDIAITPELICEFWHPYWVGFYGRADEASIVVLDAVRRTREGAKAREVIRDWISSGQGSDS